MDASPVRIIEYFDGEKQSIIPLFQRPYTWERKNWDALWTDVLTQYCQDQDKSTHFMGAIVSIPATTVPVGVRKHLVIDGQQRLTTVALLLRAIRDFVTDDREKGRIDDYLINRHRDGIERLKLLPTQGDRSCYTALLNEPDEGSSHRMCKALDFFRRAMTQPDPDDQSIDPSRLLQVVTQRLHVVMINLGESDDPYLIFESLNYKGEPLTQADLVRNYILMRFSHSLEPGGDQERVYDTVWKPLEERLGSQLTEYLRHYSMKDGENVKQGGVYAALKRRIADLPDAESVQSELQRLNLHGTFYKSFIDPSAELSHAVRRKLHAILALETTTCYPLLLRLFESRHSGLIDDDALVQCLTYIESFVVRRSVCNVPTNALNKLFLQWSRGFPTSTTDVPDWLCTSMAAGGGSRRWPDDKAFENAFINEPQYGRNRKATRHILIRLEEAFEHKEPVDLELATIEHVMPQTLDATWKEQLGSTHAAVHTQWVDTLGNLTLTGYNSELGNMTFDKKKEFLQNSHIELNAAIAAQESWNEQTIRERARTLFQQARELFPGPNALARV